MRTISRLAKQFRISRTALLYYDSTGLLKASRRSASGYRLYGENEVRRLETICSYRKAGLSLKDIKALLSRGRPGSFARILEKRLTGINDEIRELQNQQCVVLALLQNRSHLKMGKINKEQWIQIFRKSGLTDEQMLLWHRTFEKNSPEGHQEFLEFLSIPKAEIQTIRSQSRN